MNRIVKTLGILALISASIFACKNRKKTDTPPPPPPTETKVPVVIENKNHVDTPHIISISELYVRSCGVCHEPYPPTKYSSESWGHILDSMQKRAHITDLDKADLYKFLTTADTAK